MPFQRALVGMPAVRVSVRVEIRESIELRVPIGVILVHHVNLQLAEFSREAHLAIGRNVLRWEEQDLVAQPRLVDHRENVIADSIRQAYTRDLGAEPWRQRSQAKRRLQVVDGSSPGTGSIAPAYQ